MDTITPKEVRRLCRAHPTGLASLTGDEPDDHLALWAALRRGELLEELPMYDRVVFSIVIEGERKEWLVGDVERRIA